MRLCNCEFMAPARRPSFGRRATRKLLRRSILQNAHGEDARYPTDHVQFLLEVRRRCMLAREDCFETRKRRYEVTIFLGSSCSFCSAPALRDRNIILSFVYHPLFATLEAVASLLDYTCRSLLAHSNPPFLATLPETTSLLRQTTSSTSQ